MVAKGVSVKYTSYAETVPKVLDILKFDQELKKHTSIVLKPVLNTTGNNTNVAFVEAVLVYCLAKKQPQAQIYIAEGSEGAETEELFDAAGYTKLAERYGVSLVDLNTALTEPQQNGEFLKHTTIQVPVLLKDAFVIALPQAGEHPEWDYSGALATMLGAYPARHYRGWFTKQKSKLREFPLRFSIHDMLKCKMPNTAIIDASDKGLLFIGDPFELDKQVAKLYKGDWKHVSHLRLIEEAHAYHLKRTAQRAQEKELAELMPKQIS